MCSSKWLTVPIWTISEPRLFRILFVLELCRKAFKARSPVLYTLRSGSCCWIWTFGETVDSGVAIKRAVRPQSHCPFRTFVLTRHDPALNQFKPTFQSHSNNTSLPFPHLIYLLWMYELLCSTDNHLDISKGHTLSLHYPRVSLKSHSTGFPLALNLKQFFENNGIARLFLRCKHGEQRKK